MKPKVLLIEDDKPTIELYQEVFSQAGFDLEIANTCSQGIEILQKIRKGKRKPPDLVLLDLILTDQNGINFLIEAKKHSQTKNLKIFALTNYTDSNLNKELIKQGIDKILVKTDYTPKQLVEILKKELENRDKNIS